MNRKEHGQGTTSICSSSKIGFFIYVALLTTSKDNSRQEYQQEEGREQKLYLQKQQNKRDKLEEVEARMMDVANVEGIMGSGSSTVEGRLVKFRYGVGIRKGLARSLNFLLLQ